MSGPWHLTEVRVRWNECDPAGIVYFPNYFTYFELGSMDYLRARGAEWQALRRQLGFASFPRVEASARYRASARFDDRLMVHTRVREVARKVITFEFRLHRQPDGALMAEGQVKAAFTNAEGRAMVIPPTVVAWFLGQPLGADAMGDTGSAADGGSGGRSEGQRLVDLAPPDA